MSESEKKFVTVEESEKKRRKSSGLYEGKSLTKSIGAFSRSSTITSRMKIRKKSYGFSGVPGFRNIEKSASGHEFRRPVLTFLNTYQLDPHPKFDPVQARKAADAILDEVFTKIHKYNVQESPALAIRISRDLMRQVKGMQFNRYRIISVVTIGQKRSQSYINAVAFIWDHERDDLMNLQREEHSCFIQVTLFAIYLD